MIRSIALNNRVVMYELTRKRVKNINLRIRNDGTVAVSCNSYVSAARIEAFLRDRASFILNAIDKTEVRAKNSSRPVMYEDGEKVSVFGNKYTLRVLPGARRDISVKDNEIVITAPHPDRPEELERIYEGWRRMELKSKVMEMCEEFYPVFRKMGVGRPEQIKFRKMTSRWGSCRPTLGTLTFSYNLFETPDEAIEYVVVHEFAHFIEANHSARFYKIVGEVLPDWKRRRKLLNEY